MSVNVYNKNEDKLNLIAGGTLYADAPVGSIQAYGGTTAPSGWLLCQGQAVSRTEYAELFKAIGTAFGAGNGSTTFNVPDLRETVPVGAGENGIQTIENHDVYTLGEFKDDQLQSHTHIYTRSYTGNNNMLWHLDTTSTVAAGTGSDNPKNGTGAIKDAVGRTGETTHGKQLGVNYIIKAKQVSVPFDMAEYIRNQNTPDWSNAVAISPSAIQAGYTVPSDGWVVGAAAPDGSLRFTINDVFISFSGHVPNSYRFAANVQMKVSKNDVVKTNLAVDGYSFVPHMLLQAP